MNKLMKIVSGSVLVSAGLLAPAVANAQELGVRGEAGVAFPLTGPQESRFNPGGDFAIRGVIGIGSYFDVGPVVSALALPSNVKGVDSGTAFGVGGGLRVKRPHDAKNTGHGFSATSPWLDGDLQYVRTGDLNRAAASVGAGLSVPLTDSRVAWLGPYVRYLDVAQTEHPGFDNTDAHLFIVGLSLELGPKVAQKVAPAPVVVVLHPAPTPVVVARELPPAIQETEMELKQVIQFAWDSPALDATATAQLEQVVKELSASKGFGAIKVEGHASSEGQVEHNNVLAVKRAQSVVDFLVAHGVDRDKLSASGFGSRVPVASNKTEAGRVLNRRAEFEVKFVVVKEGK